MFDTCYEVLVQGAPLTQKALTEDNTSLFLKINNIKFDFHLISATSIANGKAIGGLFSSKGIIHSLCGITSDPHPLLLLSKRHIEWLKEWRRKWGEFQSWWCSSALLLGNHKMSRDRTPTKQPRLQLNQPRQWLLPCSQLVPNSNR